MEKKKLTKEELAKGFIFMTPADKRRLLEWVECQKIHPHGRLERPLLIVGPMGSGKTTLAARLMEYFGERPLMFWPPGGKLEFKSATKERELLQKAATSEIVTIDGVSLVKAREVYWMENHVPDISIKIRKPKTIMEVETYTMAAHLVVTALAMTKGLEKKLLTSEGERHVKVVRLAAQI